MYHAGIDYGNKTAGTTVIAALIQQKVHFFQSEKKKDADRFILEWARQYHPKNIFLDAPLSLPKIYSDPQHEGSYFYREADQILRAMSPMFLGGLTARAMQLKAQLNRENISVLEAYPKQIAMELLRTENGYKKAKEQLPICIEQLLTYLPFSLASPPSTWHHFDALLAFTSGWRYENNLHQSFGDPSEGIIIV